MMPTAPTVPNVLFIMADQFRWDHLSCSGHPFLTTPNIDALARRGVRFANAFANSGVCGPSRMSFYTGRYAVTHGATWNRVPLSLAERTFGDYLHEAGRIVHLAGKSHVLPDREGLDRLGPGLSTQRRAFIERGGFDEIDRYDGHFPPGPESGYAAFLRDRGYGGADPWSDYVISAIDTDGTLRSGWQMRNCGFAARVREEHSETAYMTDRAIAFMQRMGGRPWALHLSYVKPHWPYLAPAPYHRLYSPGQCLPVHRNDAERIAAHPVVAAYREHEESVSFRSDQCIAAVRPAYQGLIKQLDDHLGRLFEHMEATGLMKDTFVIFTADHGDLLGDHWLGEKELFYDAVQRIPFIVVDPRPEADMTRGRVDERFVEGVDVLPTLLDTLGLPVPEHRIEGRSLQPLLFGQSPPWREFVFSELDYSFRLARTLRGKAPRQARAFSIRDARWRYVHWLDEPEQLFDLLADPDEFNDLGRDVVHQGDCRALRERLLDFLARRKHRVTVSDAFVADHTNQRLRAGVRFGQW